MISHLYVPHNTGREVTHQPLLNTFWYDLPMVRGICITPQGGKIQGVGETEIEVPDVVYGTYSGGGSYQQGWS